MATYVFNPLTRQYDITGDASSSLTDPVVIGSGGTGQITAQTAINALTRVSEHSTFDVLTKQTDGDAEFSPLRIPEVTTNPTAPVFGQLWVLRADTGGTAGTPVGMLLAVTQTVGATTSYTLKFKTSGGAIVSEVLT